MFLQFLAHPRQRPPSPQPPTSPSATFSFCSPIVFPPSLPSTGATACSTSPGFTSWSPPVLATGCVTRTTLAAIQPRPTACRSSKNSLQRRYGHCHEGPDAVELEAYVKVKLGRNPGAWVAAWGYVSQEPVRSLWLPFDPLAENMVYALMENVLRPQPSRLVATTPRLCRFAMFSCPTEHPPVEQLMTQATPQLLRRSLAPSSPGLPFSLGPSCRVGI